ncbi:hypothetical protein FNV68_20495 [Streptomyces sp. S1D4-23]|nr:hypothetical protein FNV61_19405 [Streptomyces sp. RLB3-6]QDO08332.1 hypothetical protein FNV68_20495 [Streptomyces sp. S1D4-23]
MRGELRDQPPPTRSRTNPDDRRIRGAAPVQGRGELRDQPPPVRGRMDRGARGMWGRSPRPRRSAVGGGRRRLG